MSHHPLANRRFALTLAVLACLSTAAQAARVESVAKEISRLESLYKNGRFEETIVLSTQLQGRDIDREQTLRCLELQAFSHFILGAESSAKDVWQRLLRLDPNHALDPVRLAPELCAFFSAQKPPQPEPTADKGAGPPSSDATLLPSTNVESLRSATIASRGCGVGLCFVPFGVGQLANGHTMKGVAFGSVEVLALLANVALYQTRVRDYDRRGYFDDVEAADRSVLMQRVAFGVFASAVIAGVLDAYFWP